MLKERAGTATGIFGTMRVVAEGVPLAKVSVGNSLGVFVPDAIANVQTSEQTSVVHSVVVMQGVKLASGSATDGIPLSMIGAIWLLRTADVANH